MEVAQLDGCNKVFYIKNAINPAQAKLILHNIDNVPSGKWRQLKNRRLQMYGGTPSEKGMIVEKIPSWLSDLTNF